MPRQAIELGTAPTGQGGDTNRDANTKINAMTAELYASAAKADTALQPVAGSGLYPNADRTKLAGIAAGAQVNAAAGTQAEAEDGTGTELRSWSALRLRQAAAAWYASAERVLNRVLTGFVTTTNSAVTAADTLIVALGKIQAQLNALPPAELYRRSNILGIVSQSAGVPTGAIIERGSNANGDYVRFADGTLMCTVMFTGYSADVLKTVPLPASIAAGTTAALSAAVVPVNNYDYSWTGYVNTSSVAFISQSNSPGNIVTLLVSGRWY